ncbi:hypothetical protein CDL15_Pgr014143 [Punica granatum]|uniref:Uncharacterized protein n=1 Tax=Punica granatum TaxID=22663 RepID=A0A218XYW8_PUNGR|nr:hypothetical protein CDL15_Pgr014143 [Punica granatum]
MTSDALGARSTVRGSHGSVSGDAPWGSMRIAMKLLRRCSAPGVAVCLTCRKPILLLGRLLVALPGAGFIAGAIVVCWGCPGLAMRDSSSGVERLRIPRGRKSESAVVLVGGCTCDPDIISKSWDY